MFTGIIEELGEVRRIERRPDIVRLLVNARIILDETKPADSISVNGVCLTVTDIDRDGLSFDVIPETLSRTNLGDLKIRDKVNLERSLRLTDRLSGHLVTGHIDCVGIVRQKRQSTNETIFNIAIPDRFSKYIVPKGSVALDGISLTVAQVQGNLFSVHIIPYTLKNTNLRNKGPSSKVNIEVDLIGKYVESLSSK
jgi:riboflavin synthase